MKKILWFLVIGIVFCLCSCDITSKLTYYSVAVIDDGEVIESRALLKGSYYTLPAPQKEDGFKGWKVGDSSSLLLSGSIIKITSNTTITAVREESSPQYCSLVLLSKGNVLESKVIVKDSDYVLPPSPDGTGFKGWRINNSTTLRKSGESIKISEDTEITACWNDDGKVNCSVVVLNKGELLESKIVLSDSVYTLPSAPAGDGFKGWRVGNSDTLYKSGTSLKITSDTTITANWTENPLPEPVYYAVAVVDNGAIVDALAVKEGDSYTLPSVSAMEGYFFSGWKVGDYPYYYSAGVPLTITSNTTIKAVWTPIYTIIVEVPQNVTNVQTITVNVGNGINFETNYFNYKSADNGYYQYSFQLTNLIKGKYAVNVSSIPAGVSKNTYLFIGDEADKTITIRLADISEVIDLSDVSISTVIETRVDSNYNVSKSIMINVPDDVSVYYTTDGSIADEGDPLYRNGILFTFYRESTLNTYAVAEKRFATGSRYKSFNIELSVIGAKGPAGGYIFYDKGEVSDGWRMLEVGKSEIISSYCQWGMAIMTLNTAANFGYGKKNTEEIINAKKSNSSLSFPAAEAVWDVDVYGNGYKDWFLPSTFEMYEMYTVLKKIGLAGSFNQYGTSCWSSTSSDTLYAGAMDLWNGSFDYTDRGNWKYVWPIRQF